MPNAFGCLSAAGYGPQFIHNVAFIGNNAHTVRLAEGWLRSLRAERKIGTVCACVGVCDEECSELTHEASRAIDIDLSDIELAELEELEPEDFDTVVRLIACSELTPVGSTAHGWESCENCFEWTLPGLQNVNDFNASLQGNVRDLLAYFDELAMKRACGQGTSC
eukprot:TRINITY_DN65790_c0_g1_i1.p1 TRINITY_DN65790_c0_g1~~TRINITY_DN65790_c0_g1_i1.p1  ORF type:complete len:188 (+),score=19.29 TRINITY_DN65790_c0_g1_i1:71-565(+)